MEWSNPQVPQLELVPCKLGQIKRYPTKARTLEYVDTLLFLLDVAEIQYHRVDCFFFLFVCLFKYTHSLIHASLKLQ